MTSTDTAITAIVLRELRDIAIAAKEANGGEDHVYRSPDGLDCFYVHRHPGDKISPGCIVGKWLHEVRSISLWRLISHEGSMARMVIADLLPSLPPGAREAVNLVQSKQDQQIPWLEAVQRVAAELKVELA